VDVVLLLILFVAGVVVLAGSMALTSPFLGGIEFGQAHVAAAKGAGLVLAVNLVAVLVPYGVFLVAPVWWLGLVLLFRIDFWQVWPLVLINWVPQVAAYFLVLLLLRGSAPVETELKGRVILAPSGGRPALYAAARPTPDRFTP
jgi:hypothetical protein